MAGRAEAFRAVGIDVGWMRPELIVGTLTGLVAIAALYGIGPGGIATHVAALAVVAGTVATLSLSRHAAREAAFLRRSLERLVVSVMPDHLVVGALRARVSAIAAQRGLPVLKPWEGQLLDEPAWVWSFHPSDNAPAGGILILGQPDLARLVLVGDDGLDAELRRAFFEPNGRVLEEAWDQLSHEVSLAAAWAFRQQPSATLIGVAKYASIQTRELGAAPKTTDGIDVSRERVFGQTELDRLGRLPRVERTVAFIEKFAEPRAIAPSPAKERLIAG